MSFKLLYEHVCTVTTEPVVIDRDIVPKVKQLTGQDQIYFVPVELDTSISLGHIKQYRDIPRVVYGDPPWITEIRWHQNLNMCWRRWVCCKELMHTFDTGEERTDSRAKYLSLMNEVESPKLPGDQSPMMNSENRTKWMALAVLCPLHLRNKFIDAWRDKKMSNLEIALRLRIPEATIKTVMEDYFEQVISELTE